MTVCVDSSALVELGRGLPRAASIAAVLRAHEVRLASAATLLETCMVMGGTEGATDELASRFGLTVIPVDDGVLRAAWQAWRTFGRGQHPARLNFGDCFSYATARTANVPMLFVGEDFALTDIVPALPADSVSE